MLISIETHITCDFPGGGGGGDGPPYPPSRSAHDLGHHLEYFKTQKTTTICQSNFPNITTIENYQKIVINCDQVKFYFKMLAILDTILNI